MKRAQEHLFFEENAKDDATLANILLLTLCDVGKLSSYTYLCSDTCYRSVLGVSQTSTPTSAQQKDS